MATFTVTNTNDAGAGSFRQALLDAFNSAGADTITFDPSLASGSINLLSVPSEINGLLTLRLQPGLAIGYLAGTPLDVGANGALQFDGDAIFDVPLRLNGTGVADGGAIRHLTGTSILPEHITLAADSRINSDAGLISINGAVSGAGHSLTLGGAGTVRASSFLSGLVDLTKDGSGTLELRGVNAFTGTVNVEEGVVQVYENVALGGSAGGGTIVSDGAALELHGNRTINGEALILNGDGVSGAGALRHVSGSTDWNGATTLGSDAKITADAGVLFLLQGISSAGHDLTVGGAGTIQALDAVNLGTGGITKVGSGELFLADANTYSGVTTILGGTVRLGNGGAMTAANDVVIADVAGARLVLDGPSQTIGSLSGGGSTGGAVEFTSADLTIDQDTDTTFAGVISSTSAGLIKAGTGELTLTGANTYSGLTTVAGGRLQIDGSLAGGATVQAGGELGGTGDVLGTVTVQAGGRVAAGESPGLLSTGNLTLASGGTLEQEIDGASTGQFDVVDVTGTVTLGGAILDVQLGAFTPTVGASFVIIDNDGADGVVGTFAGLAEGANFAADGFNFVISYAGGDGNDVELTVAAAPDSSPPTLSAATVNGAALVLTWSESLAVAGPPAAGAFTVMVAGSAMAVTGVTVNGAARTVTLTLATPVAQGQAVTLAYADPTGGNDANAVQDIAGNDAASFGATAVTNNTPPPPTPAPSEPLPPPPPPAIGTSGDDVVILDTTQRSYDGGAGDDHVTGSYVPDTLSGGEGNDSLFGGADDDVLSGGPGANVLRGGDGRDDLTGGDAFDDLHGNIGDDTVRGGGGGDWVVGGQGQDALFGDDGEDVLLGNLGHDILTAGDGDDVARGGQGDDSVSGGSGNDWLAGDRGSDTLSGGAGADIFHAWGDAGLDLVTDFSAADGDRVHLLAGTQYALAQVGADAVITMNGGGQLVLRGVQLAGLPEGWIV
ncbi:SwmB domain-containing protein [Phenylobacterium sp.]|uniref:SwmB domain-containing protein n=1 Tax=Phenylobacterium sp. TaxID=1871053 RepID=UPI0035AD7C78